MGVVRSGHFWQLGSIAPLATETTGGEILVAFWSKHCLGSDLRVPNFKTFSWGSMPLAYSHLSARNGRTSSWVRPCGTQRFSRAPGTRLGGNIHSHVTLTAHCIASSLLDFTQNLVEAVARFLRSVCE